MPILSDAQIIAAISGIQSLRGAGIGYQGGGRSRVIREAPAPYAGDIWVVIEEQSISRQVAVEIVRTSQNSGNYGEVSPNSVPRRAPVRDSRWGREAVGAGFSCAMAGLAASTGAAALTAAAAITGPFGLIIAAAVWIGGAAAAAQCGIGIGRLANELTSPENNDILDDNAYYRTATFAIDMVGVLTGVVAAGPAIRTLALRVNGNLISRGVREGLRGANYAQRGAAIRAALNEMSAAERQAILAEINATETTLGRGLSRAGARRATEIITQQEAQQLRESLREVGILAIQNSVNMVSSEYVGSASGSLNTMSSGESRAQLSSDVSLIVSNIIQITD